MEMQYVIAILLLVSVGFVWTRIFASPVYWFLGRFIEDRLKRLFLSGVIFVVLSSLASWMLTSFGGASGDTEVRDSKWFIVETFLPFLVFTLAVTALWVLVEYRYGGSLQDQRIRHRLARRGQNDREQPSSPCPSSPRENSDLGPAT